MTIGDSGDDWTPLGYTSAGFVYDADGIRQDGPPPELPSRIGLGPGELFTSGPVHTIDGPIGRLRQCRTCAAPIVSPFPADWELELIKEGPPGGPVDAFCTPHRPGCAAPRANPQPGIVVRVSGRYVTDVRIDPGGVDAHERSP